jgi:hypothetical protein
MAENKAIARPLPSFERVDLGGFENLPVQSSISNSSSPKPWQEKRKSDFDQRVKSRSDRMKKNRGQIQMLIQLFWAIFPDGKLSSVTQETLSRILLLSQKHFDLFGYLDGNNARNATSGFFKGSGNYRRYFVNGILKKDHEFRAIYSERLLEGKRKVNNLPRKFRDLFSPDRVALEENDDSNARALLNDETLSNEHFPDGAQRAQSTFGVMNIDAQREENMKLVNPLSIEDGLPLSHFEISIDEKPPRKWFLKINH